MLFCFKNILRTKVKQKLQIYANVTYYCLVFKTSLKTELVKDIRNANLRCYTLFFCNVKMFHVRVLLPFTT